MKSLLIAAILCSTLSGCGPVIFHVPDQDVASATTHRLAHSYYYAGGNREVIGKELLSRGFNSRDLSLMRKRAISTGMHITAAGTIVTDLRQKSSRGVYCGTWGLRGYICISTDSAKRITHWTHT